MDGYKSLHFFDILVHGNNDNITRRSAIIYHFDAAKHAMFIALCKLVKLQSSPAFCVRILVILMHLIG